LNEFVWPGRNIYPVPGGCPDQYEYGLVPPKIFNQVRDAVVALDDKKSASWYVEVEPARRLANDNQRRCAMQQVADWLERRARDRCGEL
jgi:hypothetical protein